MGRTAPTPRACSAHDEELRREGLLPIDVAHDGLAEETATSPRLIAVWAEPDADILDARLLAGPADRDQPEIDRLIERGIQLPEGRSLRRRAGAG